MRCRAGPAPRRESERCGRREEPARLGREAVLLTPPQPPLTAHPGTIVNNQPLIFSCLSAIKHFQEMEEDKGQSAKATSVVGDLRKSWQTWAEDHIEYQRKNPFSSEDRLAFKPVHTHRGDPTYGRPPEGSQTEQRGKDAQSHVGKEVEELCLIIKSTGEVGEDGHVSVTFGQLFETYVTISNKVVGILLRARKQGLVHFEGEMLWQGKDDGVIITLLE